ncbi:MAG: hypothetical protein Q9200_006350 [Gallowayella weberi]
MINIISYPLSFTIVLLQLHLATVTAVEPWCYRPPGPFGKLIFSECRQAIGQITQTRNPSTQRPFNPSLPLLFSRYRSERPDVKTPKSWSDHVSSGDCIVGVDIPDALARTDKTSLDDVKNAAMAVAVECVMQGDHLGGMIRVGWQNSIFLVIRSFSDPSIVPVGGSHHLNGTLAEV